MYCETNVLLAPDFQFQQEKAALSSERPSVEMMTTGGNNFPIILHFNPMLDNYLIKVKHASVITKLKEDSPVVSRKNEWIQGEDRITNNPGWIMNVFRVFLLLQSRCCFHTFMSKYKQHSFPGEFVRKVVNNISLFVKEWSFRWKIKCFLNFLGPLSCPHPALEVSDVDRSLLNDLFSQSD